MKIEIDIPDTEEKQKEDRLKVLQRIFQHFIQIIQWFPSNIENSTEYMYKAKGLIEYLEIEDCGSTGGFDRNNPITYNYRFSLYDRFIALCNKYNQIDFITYYGSTPHSVGKYFLEADNLKRQ